MGSRRIEALLTDGPERQWQWGKPSQSQIFSAAPGHSFSVEREEALG